MAAFPAPEQHGGLSLHMGAYAPLERQAPHAHDTANITLVLSGALEERTEGGVARAGVCSVVVKPADCVHEDLFGPAGARTMQLKLSPELARVYAPHLKYRWIDGGEAARAMIALMKQPSPDADQIWNGFIDVLGALPAETTPRTYRVANRALGDLAARIDESPGAFLSIRETAGDLRLHPVSLARAFRRHYGCSITDYIRRARLLRACRLLDEGAMPLSTIAAEMGFADQAHFTRAFRTETGLPPGAFRKLARPRP